MSQRASSHSGAGGLLSLPVTIPLIVALSVLSALQLGCADPETVDALQAENERLAQELATARDELQNLRFELQRSRGNRPAGSDARTATPTGPDDGVDDPGTRRRLKRALEQCDAEIEQLQGELRAAQETAQRYREAGERAVKELNRRPRPSQHP